MRSELFQISLRWLSSSVGGITVSTLIAGLLVVASVGILIWGKQRDRMADAWGYVPGLWILAVVVAMLPRLGIEYIPIRGYGVMVLSGAILGLVMVFYRARYTRFDPEMLLSLAFWGFICGIVGGRLFFVIEYWDSRFRSDDWMVTLLRVVKFTEGGLVIYGAFLGAVLAFSIFVIRRKVSALALADLIAPSLLVGLALGRIGCFLNGCCYGGECELPWAVRFPRSSLPYTEQVVEGRMLGLRLSNSAVQGEPPRILSVDENSPAARAGLSAGEQIVQINGYRVETPGQAQEALYRSFGSDSPMRLRTAAGKDYELPPHPTPSRSLPIHPTQLYSAIHAGLLAWLLWSYYPFRRREGEVTALMLTIYPIARFLLEVIRIDESAVFGTGLSISQNISLVIFVFAVGLWTWLLRQPVRLQSA